MNLRVSLLLTCVVISFTTVRAPAQVEPFIGEIRYVAFNFAPLGWALCEGQTLPIAQNTALFSLLGTTFGGDGVRTFNLPDMRGRVPVAPGQGPGLSDRILGETGGQESVALTVQQMPKHRHALRAVSGSADTTSPTGGALANSSSVAIYSTSVPNTTLFNESIGHTGRGEPHENMQPFLGMTCIIALEGIFPARN